MNYTHSIHCQPLESETIIPDNLILALPESESFDGKNYPFLNQTVITLITKMYDQKIFTGKLGTVKALFLPEINQGMIILTGMGKKEKITQQILRNAIGKAFTEAVKNKPETLHIVDTFSSFLKESVAKISHYLTITIASVSYHFTDYNKKKQEESFTVKSVVFITENHPLNWEKGIETGLAVAEGMNLIRDLGNHPGNIATPTYLAEKALELAEDSGIHTTILGKAEMEALGMGALLGVSRGSNEAPKFIIMEYFGDEPDVKPVVLVGKGLTFDAGGISIKPAAGMDEMKFDMLGGAAVMGIMKSVSKIKPALNIVGLIPSSENLLGGSAMKPGDILTAYNGKTIEVLNTDAEGRLILSDALAYASDKYQPRLIFDFATLTGAVLVALGHEATGILGNDQTLIEELKYAADQCGERVWQLPIYDEFREMMKSKTADLANIGKGRLAGTATAAAFLENFVGENIPWVHFDIAGTAWIEKDLDYIPEGPSGVGPQLITEFLKITQ